MQKNLTDSVINKLKGAECQRCSVPFSTPLGFPQLCKECSKKDTDKKRIKRKKDNSEILTDLMEER